MNKYWPVAVCCLATVLAIGFVWHKRSVHLSQRESLLYLQKQNDFLLKQLKNLQNVPDLPKYQQYQSTLIDYQIRQNTKAQIINSQISERDGFVVISKKIGLESKNISSIVQLLNQLNANAKKITLEKTDKVWRLLLECEFVSVKS